MAERALPGQVAGGLRALSTEIDRLDQAAADRYGLNRTDMRALDILGRAGPLAPTALARLLGFTTGGITTVLDRLERAGYIRRRPDPPSAAPQPQPQLSGLTGPRSTSYTERSNGSSRHQSVADRQSADRQNDLIWARSPPVPTDHLDIQLGGSSRGVHGTPAMAGPGRAWVR